ncbi:hypothetical protein FSP39_017271 [Pinctada imbricata]|uniref:Diacylglycerol kinase n=1 Tax=Pinctada imbricata TaxID=66713 RepID=A0AA89BXF4_PINIB|nr:hypothetical protein FSP39_017271 [Pinctada imbricata]
MDSVLVLSVFGFTFLVIYLWMRKYRNSRLQHYEVLASDVSKGHKFYMEDIFPDQTYCNIGHYKIRQGACCESCGICVDDHSMKAANKRIPCKPVSQVGEMTSHHWVRGNLSLYSKCYICDEDCGTMAHMSDFRCAWCGRSTHENCIPKEPQACDMGPFQQFVIPPNCVKLQQKGFKGRRHYIVSEARKPPISNWSPLIVFANKKSGNNDGQYILRAFRGVLNSSQVIDLDDIPPEGGLEWCHLLSDVTARVLVCGGDGSIGWVLSAIENLNFKNPPLVCILPLGTGNDLSRVLGWGEGYTHDDVRIEDFLRRIQAAHPIKLDRYVMIRSYYIVHILYMVMSNYCSLGVDALVTLNFHRQRESRPWLFAHRVINKLCYFYYGTKDVLENECKHLNKKIKVELDGVPLTLPEIEGFVVLNISSWGGGCQPWGTEDNESEFKQPRYDDGLLEVMGLYSSFHIAQLQVGLADPIKLGQAKVVKISLRDSNVPMQVDGEPWEQTHPSEIVITHKCQANLLALNHRSQVNFA